MNNFYETNNLKINKPIEGFLFFSNKENSNRNNNISYWYYTDWGRDLKTFDRWYGLKPDPEEKTVDAKSLRERIIL